MRKFTWVLFVVVLVIVAIATFRPQPPFPSTDNGFITGIMQTFLPGR